MRTTEEIYAAMLAELSARTGASAAESCDMAVRLYAAAAQISALCAQADFVAAQCFPQTAAGEYLDRHAALRGLTRKSEARAAGTLRFSASAAAAAALPIEAGTVCRTAGDVRYETTEAGEIAAGETYADIPARAAAPGAAGNAAAGTVTLMVTPPVGVTACTNPAAFSGGADGEDDESLRARILAGLARISNGANAAYYEQAALDYPGVAAARVLPRSRGTGTVDVVVSAPDGLPAAALVEGLQSRLAAEREIGVDLRVLAPTAVTVDVAAALTLEEGAAWDAVSTAAEAALRACFDGTQLGRDVLRARLGSVLFSVPGVANYTLSEPAADVAVTAVQLPALGTLTLTQAS